MPATPSAFRIRTLPQIRALRSPLRQEIIDALSAAGPRTIAEIAALLDRRPDGLYFHMRLLEKTGLVIQAESKRDGRHVATVYDLPGRPMTLKYESEDPANLRAIANVLDGVLRLSKRDFSRCLGKPWAVTEGPKRNTWGGRTRGWLTPAEAEKINKHLSAISEIVRAGRPRAGARPHALTCVMVPLALPNAARGPREGKAGNKQRGDSA